jgi:DNA-binding PadR family transcriptional regulator
MNLSLLDVFVLSLLDRGLKTPYSLQREGGLSLGATTPSLRRLSSARLVTRGDFENATRRPRHEYRLTSAGRKALLTGWREHFDKIRIASDLDSVLRLVDLAVHYGAKRDEIGVFLKRAAEQRFSRAHRAETLISPDHDSFSYQQTRWQCESARLEAEASVLSRLATEFQSQPHQRTARVKLGTRK